MNIYLLLKSNKGQALIENVLIIPILVIIIVMTMFFARLVLTKQQLVMAARYGTDLIAYTELQEPQIKQEIIDYLCSQDAKGRRLDPDKLRITANIDRMPDAKFSLSSFNIINRLSKTLDYFYDPCGHTSYVEIQYEFYTPKIFSAWGSYLSDGTLPEKIYVSGRSEVLAGTGA